MYGMTPNMYAFRYKYVDSIILDKLLKYSYLSNDDIDYLGNTPLIYAVINNNINVVKRILEENLGENYINHRNKNIMSALDYAEYNENDDIYNLLISYGAIPSAI